MASSSDGIPVLPPMPDFSSKSSNNPFSTAGDMKFHLQNLLDSKERQLQQAGTLGQRVLAQQMELEERIRQLQEIEADKTEDEEIDGEVKERYQELAQTIVSWDEENAQLSSAFGASSKRFPNGSSPSPLTHYTELPREEPERTKNAAGTSAAQSRRAKNAAHRADDVEFAFEIGSGLLTEVRRLQSLLGERDKAIQDMKEEKDDLEKSVESLRTALRQQEQSADKYKEENWNLEVTLQDLRTQLNDSQSTASRLESEHKRLTKLLHASRDTSESHKNECERLQTTLDELKSKHEYDVAQARKHAAGLARDKSDLQQTIDTMKVEVARAGRRFPKFGSPLTPNSAEDDKASSLTPANELEGDVFGTAGASTNRRKLDASAIFGDAFNDFDNDDSPDPSPVKRRFLAPNHPNNEIEALQQRLAHAQRQINTLKGSLSREKQLRMRLETSAGMPHQELEDEVEEVEEDQADTTATGEPRRTKRTITPFKVGAGSRGGRGRGRGGRGGITLIQRLGMAAASPASDFNDDDERRFSVGDSPTPPVPPIPIRFSRAEDDLEDEVSQFFSGEQQDENNEEDRRISRSPSPNNPHSNRTSVDGMDPAFANVLRRVPSNGSYTSSPLRQTILGRSARGGGTAGRRSRGGVPYKEARPPSLVDAPEVLAAELGVGVDGSPMKMGLGASPMKGEDIPEEDADADEFAELRRGALVEVGCQTEVEAVEAERTVVLPSEPEPVVESILEPVRVDMAMQTEEEPVVVVERKEVGMQHIPEDPILPQRVESGMGTDPVEKVQAEVQADVMPEKVHMDTQTEAVVEAPRLPSGTVPVDSRRTTITQQDMSFEGSEGDTTITRRFLAAVGVDGDEDDDDDGNETETGAETETDMDDYQDARQSLMMSTPSESRESFHSLLSISDNEGGYSDSEEDDAESIKASKFSSIRDASSSVAGIYPITSSVGSSESDESLPEPEPEVTYESVGVEADLYEVPEPEIQIQVVVPPKPEVKEMSIQTDEWTPPPPPAPIPVPEPPRTPVKAPIPIPVAVSAATQTSPVLFRVGSANQQFQFVAPPPSIGAPVLAASASAGSTASSPIHTPVTGVFRENSSVSRQRTPMSERRPSIDSGISQPGEEGVPRSRVPSAATGILLNVVDKSRPPVMMLPPPPKAPPPPNSMPPPSFIPERRVPSASNSIGSSQYDMPPPRPSSPPPPELIHRATTPTFSSVLTAPGGKGSILLRPHGSSMPPSQAGLRQPPSTSSFRSAANAASYGQQHSALSSFAVRERDQRNEFSTTSLVSERSGVATPRSSISSDHVVYNNTSNNQSTPNKSADITPRAHVNPQSTDPVIIHAITQTMIGEFLYKYTRRTIGKGHGDRRHKRFFWVHPYTKTLYWSSADPGSSNISESSAKSAYIEGVRSVLDPNPMPPGLYQYSVVVSTPQREMKITAPTKERHDIWLNALKYLLSRPSNISVTSPANNTVIPQSPASINSNTEDDRRPRLLSSPQSQRSGRSDRQDTWNTTPRGQRSRSQLSARGSIGKRSGTPAIEYLRWNHGVDSPYSPSKSFVDVPGQDDEDLDFQLHGESQSDEGFEGLENVRACCDGKHTVGHSGKHHHHHHHGQQQQLVHPANRRQSSDSHLHPNPNEMARPASPAWSFRSKTGSTHSHEGGLFSWGRRDDGKLRFGSRRSTKTSVPAPDQ